MTQPQLGTFEYIALDAIKLSPTNPRKHFDQLALQELAESIGSVGIIEPVLVRPVDPVITNPGTYVRYVMTPDLKKRIASFDQGTEEENQAAAEDYVKNGFLPGLATSFELVIGERRYRAAKLAGLNDVPATIKQMTDDEVLAVQVVENLQREDLHPVEEAEGYRTLMAGGAGVEDVAKKAGKTAGHVAKMLKLLSLELPAKELFHEGHLTLGHALTLARLQPADQDRALRYLFNGAGDYTKMSTVDVIAARKRNMVTNPYVKHRRLIDATEGLLREWIQTNVLLSLAKVPWSLEDPLLVPEAGPCTTCPKRTGSNGALFADLTADQDVCLDAACFQTKEKAFVQITLKAAEKSSKPLLQLSAKTGHKPIGAKGTQKGKLAQGQWVQAKARSCESVARGILVDEPARYNGLEAKPGDVITVCANQDCKVHKHTVERPVLANSTASGRAVAESREARNKRELVELQVRTERENDIRRRVLAEVASAIAAYPSGIMRFALTLLLGDGLDQDTSARALEALHINVKRAPANPINAAEETLRDHIMNAGVDHLPNLAYVIVSADAMIINDWHDLRDADDLKESRERLWRMAEAMKINADKIAKQRETALDQEEELERKAKAASPNAELPSLKKPKKNLSEAQKLKMATAAADRPAVKAAAKKAAAKKTAPLPIDRKSLAAGERAETAAK